MYNVYKLYFACFQNYKQCWFLILITGSSITCSGDFIQKKKKSSPVNISLYITWEKNVDSFKWIYLTQLSVGYILYSLYSNTAWDW